MKIHLWTYQPGITIGKLDIWITQLGYFGKFFDTWLAADTKERYFKIGKCVVVWSNV